MGLFIRGNVTKVAIGIQARTNSSRLRGKITEKIGNKPIINHVIDACEGASHYMNRHTESSGIHCKTYLLIPKDDPIKKHTYGVEIIEGPEEDVLSRYVKLLKETDADYIVRVTSDCPLIPSFIISKAVNTAVRNQLDYLSNVDESARTAIDGHDIEVISKDCLLWADSVAVDKKDREHVTTIIRSDKLLKEFSVGVLIGYVDCSDQKLSIDTIEDLERAKEHYEKIQKKMRSAEIRFGRKSVHRI